MMTNFLNKSDEVTKEQEDLFRLLTEKALSNDNNSWEFIKNITEFGVAHNTKNGLYKVIELYERVSSSVYKKYCEFIQQGKYDFDMLVAYNQYKHCIAFYKQELATILDMLEEYKAYVAQGQFLSQVIYRCNREPWHLWDHRQGGSDEN